MPRIKLANKTVEYTLRRSARRRKTVEFRLVGGELVVSAPMRAPMRELEEMLRKRADWILENLGKEIQKRAPMRFLTGETLPYLGQNVPIMTEHTNQLRPQIIYDDSHFRIAVPDTLSEDDRTEAIHAAIAEWYQNRAAERVPEVVKQWWPQLGRGQMSRILIRNQRKRWGSCSTDGTLRFSWRIMMLEPTLIELIVVHELAHLTHQNHSKDFWSFVQTALPDTPQRRKTLRESSRALPAL